MDLGEINISGVCSVILFYLLILGVGMWAARKKSTNCDDDETTEEASYPFDVFGQFGKCQTVCWNLLWGL